MCEQCDLIETRVKAALAGVEKGLKDDGVQPHSDSPDVEGNVTSCTLYIALQRYLDEAKGDIALVLEGTIALLQKAHAVREDFMKAKPGEVAH